LKRRAHAPVNSNVIAKKGVSSGERNNTEDYENRDIRKHCEKDRLLMTGTAWIAKKLKNRKELGRFIAGACGIGN